MTVTAEFLRRRIAELEEERRQSPPGIAADVAGAGQPPHLPDMSNERLAKLEGAFDGFKTVLTIFGGLVALSVTIFIAGVVFLGNRIDRVETKIASVSDQVNALPERVNANLRELTSSLSQAITASRQQSPQIILVPTPTPGRAEQPQPAAPPP